MITQPTDKLTIRLSETEQGEWFWAVYIDDGNTPGSLKAASVCHFLGDAFKEAQAAWDRCNTERYCEHVWMPYLSNAQICEKCRICQWPQKLGT